MLLYTEIGRSVSKKKEKKKTLAVFVALCANGDQSKMGEKKSTF